MIMAAIVDQFVTMKLLNVSKIIFKKENVYYVCTTLSDT